MREIALSLSFLVFSLSASAQTKFKPLTSEEIVKDSTIKVNIIDPEISKAKNAEESIDWPVIEQIITEKYDATYADRTIAKAKIYDSYGKDWIVFAENIVKYTERYENPDNLKLMNKNAGFILKFSKNKQELDSAKRWVEYALVKDPSNEEYKKTVDLIKTKIRDLDK